MRSRLTALSSLALSATTFAAQITAVPMDSPEGTRPGFAAPAADPLDDVWSTFDPDGEFDDAVKDPTGGRAPIDEWADDPGDGEMDERGGPPNDNCSQATVIPSASINYNPAPFSTVSASVEPCEAQANCEAGGAGESNSVWWSYTPAASGMIEVNTFGSTTYNTVLSIYNGCGTGSPPFCSVPSRLACNDDASFGTQSQIFLNVTAGSLYRIKVADLNSASGGGTLDFNFRWMPPHDQCTNAIPIPGVVFNPPLINTQNADDDVCENEETCEVNNVGVSNSVWYSYVPPCNGSISLNTNGSSYDTVLSIWDACGVFTGPDNPCDFGTQIACDDDSGTGVASQLLNVPVSAGVFYLIKVSDYNNTLGGGNLDFNFVFSGAALPTADIDAPSGMGCVCGIVNVIGTASAGSDPAVSWVLDSKPASGGGWTTISTGLSPVTAAFLGAWNTTALPAGFYLLRLTVENGCGTSTSAIEIVLVDQQFDSLELREPDGGDIVGGIVCVDGTAWDQCFDQYRVDYRPAAGGSFAPVRPATPVYATTVINDPLVPNGWDTNAIADGLYDLRLEGTDDCGHVMTITNTIEIDNTPPVALITDPDGCTDVSGLVNVMGTASDANLGRWTLQYTGGVQHGWVTIAQGGSSIVNGLLATWDTSGLHDCCYTLRLVVTDRSVVNCDDPHLVEYLVSVSVGGGSTCPADLDGDGVIAIGDLTILLGRFGMVCP